MIWINITNSVVGRARLYSELRQQGQLRYVYTYRAVMGYEDGTQQTIFGVTRDSSEVVFAKQSCRYGTGGECPPSRVGRPYHAVLHKKTELLPFSLRLYEPEYRNRYHLRGEGSVVRSGVLFHHGPAKTEGCFTVAGGRAAFAAWQKSFLQLQDNNPAQETRVCVKPRAIPHYITHLVQ